MRIWAVVLMMAAGACGSKKDDANAATPPVAAKTVAEPAKQPPPPPPSAAPDPKLIERGTYIARAAGCAACHTGFTAKGPDFENPFAGGLEVPDTIGTWRTPNITQSKNSGIGNWTDAQILDAVREGVRPDGSQLYPIMPYLLYNRLTDDDGKALVAYLRTIKPIDRVVEPNKLHMPKIPAPKPPNAPDPVDDPVKHGEYLASLMLCEHCHMTPGPMGPLPDKFAGGLAFTVPMLGTGTVFSSNISPDPDTGIGKYTEDQLAQTIKTMMRPDNRPIQGPMMMMQAGWSQLDDKDIHAVAAFIKQVPAVKHKVPASTFKPNL